MADKINLVVICAPKEGSSRTTAVAGSSTTPERAREYASTIVERAR